MSESQSSSNINHNGEIDLKELLSLLWRNKPTIITSVVIFVILGIIYIFTAKEKWTSETIITQPTIGQLANYDQALSVLYTNNPLEKPRLEDVQRNIFNYYNTSISALAESLGKRKDGVKLNVTQYNKNTELPIILSFTDNTAAESQKKLTHYMNVVNQKTVNFYIKDINSAIKEKKNELKNSLQSQISVAEQKKNNHLALLEQALKIAKASNITTPKLQQSETLPDDTLFLVGSDALQSMIDNAKTMPLALDRNYYITQRALYAIENFKLSLSSLQVYSVVEDPTIPEQRDWPKNTVVLLISIIIGLLVGVIISIFRSLQTRT